MSDFVIKKGVLTSYNGSDKHVVIPDGVKEIGKEVFWAQAIKTVRIPEGVTKIGDSAFGKSTLSNVELPESLTHIGERAFAVISELKSIKLPKNLTHIGARAFDYTSITRIELPEGLLHIEAEAFPSGITSMRIPASVVEMDWAFCPNFKISQLDISANPNFAVIDGVLFNKTTSTLIRCDSDFSGDFVIPQGTTKIAASAFYYINGLKKITIPDSVTEIGRSAFEGCKQLKYMKLPKGVTRITKEMIRSTGITSLEAPEVTHVESYGVSYCDKLEYVYAPKVTYIDKSGFAYCVKLKEIILSNQLTDLGESALLACSELEYIDLGNSLINIGWCAFANCNKLGEVILPQTVQRIAAEAFACCNKIKVKVIGHYKKPKGWTGLPGKSRIEWDDTIRPQGVFSGHTVCFIGGLGFNRKKAETMVEDQGGIIASNVNKNVTIAVIGAYAEGGAAAEINISQAQKMGIKIYQEDEFVQIYGQP